MCKDIITVVMDKVSRDSHLPSSHDRVSQVYRHLHLVYQSLKHLLLTPQQAVVWATKGLLPAYQAV